MRSRSVRLRPVFHVSFTAAGLAGLAGLAALSGCSAEVTAVSPSLDDLTPGYACRVQRETELTVSGSGLAPLAVGLPESARAELPELVLERARSLEGDTVSAPERVVFSGVLYGPNAARVAWDNPHQMRLTVAPELALETGKGPLSRGLYTLHVEDPVHGTAALEKAVGVVDAPSVATAAPGLACLAEGPRTLALTGAELLELDGKAPTGVFRSAADDTAPAVGPYDVANLAECKDIPQRGKPGRTCTQGELVVPQDALPPGEHLLVLTNPAPADCATEELRHLRVVPPPAIAAAEPPVVCPTEDERTVQLSGAELLRVDGVLPTVILTDAEGAEHPVAVESLGGACEPLATEGHEVERCTVLTVKLPVLPVAAAYRPTLTVTNPEPAGCRVATTQTLTLVPAPTLAAVEPAGTCLAQGERVFDVSGTGLLRIEGVLPAVYVAATPGTGGLDGVEAAVDSLESCEPVDVTGLTVEQCARARIRIPAAAVSPAPGAYERPALDLRNPQPAGCTARLDEAVVAFPPAAPQAFVPPVLCLADGPRTGTLSGLGFVTWDGETPAVSVGDGAAPQAEVTATEGCVDVATRGPAAQLCTALSLALGADLVPPGVYPLRVTSPVPVGCQDESAPSVRIVPPPQLLAATPPVICAAEGPREVVLTGQDLLRVGDLLPSVVLTDADGQAVPLRVTGLGGDCEVLAAANPGDPEVQRCTTVTVVVPQGDPAAAYQPTLTITNPDPAGCGAASAEVLTLVPAPSLVSVTPTPVCTADGDKAIEIRGANLLTIDGAWPDFQVAGGALTPIAPVGCSPVPAAGVVVQRCDAFQLALAAGTPAVDPPGAAFVQPAVTVTNPAPAGCGAAAPGNALTVVPPPALAAVEPPAVCLAQGERTLALTGTGLLRIDGAAPRVVAGDGVELAVGDLTGCVPVPVANGATEACSGLSVTLPQGGLPDGPAALVLTNPPEADCRSRDPVSVNIVPSPTISGAEPAVVCTAEADRDVVLVGTGFVRLDGILPAVVLREGGQDTPVAALDVAECAPLDVTGHVAERCARLTIRVPQRALAAGAVDPVVAVTNPAPIGCEGTGEGALHLVPPPVLDDAGPVVVCQDGAQATLAVTGHGFIVQDGAPPSVLIDGAAPRAVRAAACTALAPGFESCDRLDVDVDPAVAADGSASIRVENPAGVGCAAEVVRGVAILSPPRVDSVEPSLVCTDDGARTLTVRGAGFVDLNGVRPTVSVGGVAYPATALSDCRAANAGPLAFQNCDTLTVEVPQASLAAGTPRVEVTGPAPAACTGGADGLLTVPPALALATVAPERVCSAAGDRTIVVTGQGFLMVDGVGPSVILGGGTFAGVGHDCQALPTRGHDVRVCTTLDVTIPQNGAAAGPTPVAVVNPAPAGCGERVEGVFQIIPLPHIAAVDPDEICEDGHHELRITGDGFYVDSAVTLGRWPASEVRFIDEHTLVALFPDDLEAGTVALTVDNGDGCTDTLPDAVVIHPMPIVFFVDPPVVYNGIGLQVTVYTSGLDAAPREVRIFGPDGTDRVLDSRVAPDRPNKVLVTLPAGLAPGEWSVEVTSRIGCVGQLPGGFTVTDRLTLALSEIDPAYVSPSTSTAITLRSPDPTPAGLTSFVSTPRAYLNPHGAGPGVLATAVRALVFGDARTLTGVVPAGLTPGAYDVVVVNPDGAVGVLDSGLHVTQDEPPVVTGVEPASLDGNGPQTVRVLGRDFDLQGVTLAMTCRDPATGALTTRPAAVNAGGTDTELQGVLPADQFTAGAVCTLTLTNADGASFRYSALSIKTPAQNLADWTAQTPMVEARRALGLAAGRPTFTSRNLYAIGGDAGAVDTAKTSVESAAVDTFGEMGAWSLQRYSLPAPRTFAGVARVGRFLYAVGGNDGARAVPTVLRSQILDPLATPEVTDLSLTLHPAQPGMPPGLWHYRVAAVFPANDASNPDGESLPGEVLVADLPDVPGLELRLEWSAVPGASGYRVYRTPAAGTPLASLQLLGTTAGDTFLVDTGAATDAREVPLPQGSTGVWHAVSSLNAAREAASVVAAPGAPGDPPGTWYLYAFGGRDGANYLRSYEFAAITLDDADGQAVGPFRTGAQSLPVGRAEGAAFKVTSADISNVAPGETWLFVGPGRTAGGFSRDVDASFVHPGGDLGAFIATDRTSNDFAGYGAGAANGFLFILGGRGGTPADSGVSAELCRLSSDPGCGQAPNEPPDIRNWNALGSRLSEPRIYPGSTQESAFFFVAGGHNGNAVVRTVDRTIQ